MSDTQRFTAMIYRGSGSYVALCPELDVASQGESVEEASANLREAVELFLETADPSEVAADHHVAAAAAPSSASRNFRARCSRWSPCVTLSRSSGGACRATPV